MGVAQNSMLALVGTAGVAASKMSSNLGQMDQMEVNKDEEMAKYAREMRDAKLKTAKNNAKISGLRLKQLRAKLKGDK